MSDAPERIWLDWPGANKGEPVYNEPPERDTQPGQTGYILLDLHTAALAARDARIAALEARLDSMAEAFDEHVVIPHRNCACHLHPPCGDCVTWDFARDARKVARALLDGGKG